MSRQGDLEGLVFIGGVGFLISVKYGDGQAVLHEVDTGTLPAGTGHDKDRRSSRSVRIIESIVHISR